MNKSLFNTSKKNIESHINSLFHIEKDFKQEYINKNTQKMTECVVKMRILQGKMTADLHLSITKLNNYFEKEQFYTYRTYK